MPGSGQWVADASLLGAAFFEEEHSDAARSFVARTMSLSAPSFVLLELASIGAKKVWRSETTRDVIERMFESVTAVITLHNDLSALAPRAFELAATDRFSAYDATYLALAERTNARVATLDRRLAQRATERGYQDLVFAVAW